MTGIPAASAEVVDEAGHLVSFALTTLSADRNCRHHLLRLGDGYGLSGFGEDLDAHVAALLGPFVGLVGEDRADQPDHGGAVREDPDDVGAATDLLVEPFRSRVCYGVSPNA